MPDTTIRDLGDSAFYKLGLTNSFHRRQPDGALVDGPFHPDARGILEDDAMLKARYGIDNAAKKGPGFGENLILDWIPELYPELGLPTGYRLTRQDVTDLRYVKGLYLKLQEMYTTKTGKQPSPDPGESKPPATLPITPAPVPTPTPGPINPTPTPAPTPTPSDDTAALKARISELEMTLRVISPTDDLTSTARLIAEWDAKTSIGTGRQARLKRLSRWVLNIDGQVRDALKR